MGDVAYSAEQFKPGEVPVTTAFTAMLLFNHLPEIKADTIIAKLGTQFPELTGKTGTARSAAGSPNALVLTLDKEPVAVMNMPSPCRREHWIARTKIT